MLHDHDQLVVGVAGIDCGVEDAKNVEPGRAAAVDAGPIPNLPVHAQGQKDVGFEAALAAAEVFGSYAHDRVRMEVELNRLADNRRIAAEMMLPQVVGDDGDRQAGALVVSGGN